MNSPAHPIGALLTASHWFKRRDEAMAAARRNLDVLVDKGSYWGYERDDPRVLKANRAWVDRARRYHALAMGRLPLFENFLVIDNEQSMQGRVFVDARP